MILTYLMTRTMTAGCPEMMTLRRLWATLTFFMMRHEGTAPEILAAFEEAVTEQEEAARLLIMRTRQRVLARH